MRARIKSFENMPERYKCCPEMIEFRKSKIGLEYQTDLKFQTTKSFTCPFCDTVADNLLSVMVFGNGAGLIPFDMIDIDEGEANDPNPTRTAISN